MKIDELNLKDDLIPVITQDTEGKVLMLAYANREAIEKTLDTLTILLSRTKGCLLRQSQ